MGYKTKRSFKKFLDNFTFEQYLISLNKVYNKNIDLFSNTSSSINYDDLEKIKNEDPYIKYILIEIEYTDIHYDYRFYLIGFLEKIDDKVEISLDVSELINAGYYSEKEKIAENSLGRDDKMIIFTEGKYDTYVIKKSLELLYPQYSNYFSFLDIELSKLELGADRLITYIKSFISAGITNRVLVLFDNDAKGAYCKQELLKIKNIPNNFVIKTYPDIDLANTYPTICPTGIENLNINGSACSIEMYLCDNALKNEGHMIPVQWSCFDEKIQKYQGSFSSKDKGDIQKRYDKILEECNKNRKFIKGYNFKNMDIL
jgi:hypothetical protein